MKIEELLERKRGAPVESISADATLSGFAKKLINLKLGALVVLEASGKLAGIISERDLLDVFAHHNTEAFEWPVSDVMTKDIITCTAQDSVADVLFAMNDKSIRHMPVVEGETLVGMISIRELTTAYDVLQKEANTDFLTQLSNRRVFLENLEIEYQRARRYNESFSIAMMDIDHFKKVNDTYGHDAGDKVIQEVSKLMMREFRVVDNVGRLGGEEFAILFPETDTNGARTACERLLESVRRSVVKVEDRSIKVTISIGLAGLTDTTDSGHSILKHSDELLYIAKRNGRDQLVCAGDDVSSDPLGKKAA